jgi:hypothetical protein
MVRDDPYPVLTAIQRLYWTVCFYNHLSLILAFRYIWAGLKTLIAEEGRRRNVIRIFIYPAAAGGNSDSSLSWDMTC